MLRTQTANLEPEQQRRLHPEFLANEQSYLAMRDSLLTHYRGLWVALADGKVVASGNNLHAVTDAAGAAGGHPYIAMVGREEEVVFRVRRAEYAYDGTYQPFPLPRVEVTFSNFTESQSQSFADAIPDTGADLCVLPDTDCVGFALFNSPYFTAISSGVVGPTVTTVIYRGKAEIAGIRLPALIQSVPGGQDRIVGRDVLNELRVLFDGPGNKVVVDR